MLCPMRKIAPLEVVRGQASYTLPADFARFIKLSVPKCGLMPTAMRPMVQGDRLVLHPIPDYSGQRELHYAARYIRDADQVYPDLTEAIAPIVLLKAKAILTNLLANSTGGDGWKYKIGDEEVDKSNQGGNLRENANHFHEVYMEAVTRHIGYVTLR